MPIEKQKQAFLLDRAAEFIQPDDDLTTEDVLAINFSHSLFSLLFGYKADSSATL